MLPSGSSMSWWDAMLLFFWGGENFEMVGIFIVYGFILIEGLLVVHMAILLVAVKIVRHFYN